MKPRTRNIIMAVVVAAIFVAAAVLLVVGITTHDEPGFASDNRWDHVPLIVACAGYGNDRQPDCEQASRVTIQVNRRVGFELFRYVDTGPDDADVLVVIGVPSDASSHWSEAGGFAEVTGTSPTYELCFVQTSNTGSVEMLYLTLHHEIGCHCTGLAHDDFDSSICRPVQRPTPDGAFPPRLTDHDVELLRERYAPRDDGSRTGASPSEAR